MPDLLKNVKYDKDSVPILSAPEIDSIAEDIICEFDPAVIHKIGMVPVGDITQRLFEKHQLKFIIEKLEPEVLGFIDMKEYKICINQDTFPPQDYSNRWRFTLAHELGHFFLHSLLGSILLQDTDAMFRILDKPSRTQITDWLEWQANTFASALLLPKTAFISFVNKRLEEYDFRVNCNQFYLDNQSENIKNLQDTVENISKKFAVSEQVAKIRLDNFGYIKYSERKSSASFNGIIDTSALDLE